MYAAGMPRNVPSYETLAVGSYYSRYSVTSVTGGPDAAYAPSQTDTSLPAEHVYDKVITARSI